MINKDENAFRAADNANWFFIFENISFQEF
jgi:hypothetical protein